MRKLLRFYLLLCGLALNAALAGVAYLEFSTPGGLIARSAGMASEFLEQRHPHLADVLEPALLALGGDAAEAQAKRPPRSNQPNRDFTSVELAVASPERPAGRVLRVGPGRDLATPSEAASQARDGDTILIEPGAYPGDVAIWQANGLTLRGDGGMVWLDAAGQQVAGDKAIWVIAGDDTTVENIAFLNARSRDRNGGGIRHAGNDLVVRNCYFFANETGILTGDQANSEILVEHSEFAWNGHAGGRAHNIYVGRVARLVFRFNHVHHALVGSQVKSRARENHILYNRIEDGTDGYSSYLVDLSNGGLAFVIGNVLQQGPLAENYHLLTFAPENPRHETQRLYVVNNTFVNDRDAGVFLRNAAMGPAYVYNNVFAGPGTLATGDLLSAGNFRAREPSLLERARRVVDRGPATTGGVTAVYDAGLHNPVDGDYRPRTGSPLVDAGAELGRADGTDLAPAFEYVHPRQAAPRRAAGDGLDVGAFEAGN